MKNYRNNGQYYFPQHETSQKVMAQQTASQTGSHVFLIKILLAGMLTALILAIIVLSCVPPVSRDALTHHLAVPKLYLQHGGIYEIPSLLFSYYPMNLDLLYLIPLYLGNDIAPKFIHFSFALLTAWLVFDYIKKRIDAIFGLLAALLFLSIPVIIKLSISVYVDLGLVFFSTASLLLLFKWREKDFARRYLLMGGVCCGLALGTKYNGLIVLLLLTLSVALICVQSKRFQDKIKESSRGIDFLYVLSAVKPTALFFLTALVIFSPWLIRNIIWTNNPVYPLYDGFFHKENPVEGVQNLDIFSYRRLAFGESLSETLSIPVRVFFEGQDDNPRYFDGKLNPYLFLLPFFAFYRTRKNSSIMKSEKVILLIFVTFYMLFAFFVRDLRIRYIAPILPPLVILSVYGWYEIIQKAGTLHSRITGRTLHSAALILFALLLFFNGKYLYDQFYIINPFPYLKGKINRDDYIERYRPEYAAYRVINHSLPKNTKVLAFFLGNRGYYCEKPIIFYPDGFKKVFEGFDLTENILDRLKKYGITHLLIRSDLFTGLLKRTDTTRRQTLIDLVKKQSRLVFNKNGYALFELG